jgi:hypothetical protein
VYQRSLVENGGHTYRKKTSCKTIAIFTGSENKSTLAGYRFFSWLGFKGRKMNYLILGGVLLVGYYLSKGQKVETMGVYPTLDIEVTAPTPTVRGAQPGTYQYKAIGTISWQNASPINDVIIVQIQGNQYYQINVSGTHGQEQIPIVVETYQMRTERIRAILKNISGKEFVRAIADVNVKFPGVSVELV